MLRFHVKQMTTAGTDFDPHFVACVNPFGLLQCFRENSVTQRWGTLPQIRRLEFILPSKMQGSVTVIFFCDPTASSHRGRYDASSGTAQRGRNGYFDGSIRNSHRMAIRQGTYTIRIRAKMVH